MRFKLFLSFIGAFVLSYSSLAQNEIDALRYSWIGTGGTARYMSLSGAMGAVGGDISCATSNPAGLARFTKSEFVFTLAHTGISTSTLYNETTAYNGKGGLGFNNLGIVAAFKNDDENEWKSVQFAIGYNKLFNFNNAIRMQGVHGNSLLDQFAGDAAGTATTALGESFPYTGFLAYEAYLIDPDLSSTNNEYTTQMFNSAVIKDRSINRQGSFGETSISISGNYLDKFYFGMSIGIPSIKFNEDYTHKEMPVDTTLMLQEYTYVQDLSIRGNGINLKLGTIYTPTDWLRLGLALHTPSAISLTDKWFYEMHSEFDGQLHFDITSDNGLFSYRMRTPGRIIGSAAVIISKYGLISAEYEYVNYGSAKFKKDNFYGSAGYTFSSENLAIKTLYNQVSNLRIGAEARYEYVTLRGGMTIYQDPFKDGMTTVDASRKSYSAGVGFRMKGFYADLGWNLMQWNEAYFMYDPILENTANISTKIQQFVVTTGFRF